MLTIDPAVFVALPDSDRELVERVALKAVSQGRAAVVGVIEERVFTAERLTYLASPQLLPRVRLVLALVDALLDADNLRSHELMDWTDAVLDRAGF